MSDNRLIIIGNQVRTECYILCFPSSEAESDPKALSRRYTPVDRDVTQTTFIEGMRFAENLLKNRSSNISNKTLHIVTDNDDPFQGSTQQERVACVFSNDAREAGFGIKTFFHASRRGQLQP